MARSRPESTTVTWPVNRKWRTKERLFWFERISGLEPGLTRDQIARRFNVNYQVVFKWTTFFDYKVKEESPGRRLDPADWASVDWSKGDLEIANGLGVAVDRIKARRRSNTSQRGNTRDEYDRFRAFVATHRDRLHRLTHPEIIRLSGCHVQLLGVSRIIRAAGVRPADPTFLWRHLDWRLPNPDLAGVWGRQAGFYAKLRRPLKVGLPLWDWRNDNSRDPEYRSALGRQGRMATRLAQWQAWRAGMFERVAKQYVHQR